VENEACSWKLFARNSKDCLSCEYYSHCSKEVEKRSPDYQLRRLIPTGIVEDDAKEYAEFLREMDKYDSDIFIEEEKLEGREVSSEKDVIKESRTYKELTPIAEYFENENIPTLFIPPKELYAATFMLVSFETPDVFTVKLTALGGVPNNIKFLKKPYKGKNNRTYKYTKRGTIEVMFPIIKNVVAYRKKHVE
jgi:hypothetical protein